MSVELLTADVTGARTTRVAAPKSRWLFSPRADVCVFGGSALVSLARATHPSISSTHRSGAVGCISEKGLWRFLDARDADDSAAVRQLLMGECRALGAREYSVVEDRNGTMKILVFKKSGDWESAVTLYTLEEMLGANMRPLS